MELNIISFGYLFLRLAPFILVCFFSLASIFNQDFKGLVYLVGLLFACFCATLVGKAVPLTPLTQSPEICRMITIGQMESISKLPLGQTVFGYTFAYLLYVMYTNGLIPQNIPTLIFFPLLIVSDFWWNMSNSCFTWLQLLLSLIVGGLVGVAWGAIIASTKSTNLLYFSGINQTETCSKASKQTFKCNVYKNGNLIAKNISN